jgi:hypothetical protein
MNKTEQRKIYATAGLGKPPRTYSRDELVVLKTELRPSNQCVIREKVQRFIRPNWDVLKETLNCNGDCASLLNECSDAQAATCYLVNQKAVDAR